MTNQQDKTGQISLRGGADVLFEEYLAAQRQFAQIRLGKEKYDSIREQADFADLCVTEDPVVRSWALTELIAEALRSGQPLDKFITLLGEERKTSVKEFLIGFLARHYYGTRHPGMCRLLARLVMDESTPRDLRGMAYFYLCRVGGVVPADPFLLVQTDPADQLSSVDWEAVRRLL